MIWSKQLAVCMYSDEYRVRLLRSAPLLTRHDMMQQVPTNDFRQEITRPKKDCDGGEAPRSQKWWSLLWLVPNAYISLDIYRSGLGVPGVFGLGTHDHGPAHYHGEPIKAKRLKMPKKYYFGPLQTFGAIGAIQ